MKVSNENESEVTMLTYDAATRSVSLKPAPNVALEIGPNGASSDFENQLGNLTQPEMTKVFNVLVKFSAEQGIDGFKPVKRFSDKIAASKRIRELRMKIAAYLAKGKAEAKGTDALATLVESGKAKMAEAEQAVAAAPKARKGKTPKTPKAPKVEPTELETAYGVRPGTNYAKLLKVLKSMTGRWVKIETIVAKVYPTSEVTPRVRTIRGMLIQFAEHAAKHKLAKTIAVAKQGKGLSISARMGE